MKNRKLLCIVISIAVLFVSLPYSVSASETEFDYVPGEIIISTSKGLIDSSTSFVTSSADQYTFIDFKDSNIDTAEEIFIEQNDEENTYLLKTQHNVLEICQELEKIPGVEYAEPNVLFDTYGFTMPGEVLYGQTYANEQKWYFEDILQIPDAWQEFETTGEGVVVAIIDNGYNLNAPDFPTNLWTDENGNHGWNTHKESSDISPIFKSDGTSFNNTMHGSSVAGIIGAQADGLNIVGGAYNSSLMLINAAHYVSDTQEPQFDALNIIKAIDFAIENNADIINMSLGAHTQSQPLEDAITRAYEAGIVMIAAAGNEGVSAEVSASIPASYSNVIGVMATDESDTSQLTNFSNYDPSGKYYDVAAPGFDIFGCSELDNKLSRSSGTSQAAPLVTSCAALYLSEYPNATVDEVYDAIRNSPTTKVTSNKSLVTDATYYFKIINAVELLNYGKVEPKIKATNGASIQPSRSYISGLYEGFKDISEFITVTDGSYEFIQTTNGNGTGSVVNIYDIYGNIFKSYTIIIFGDVNGDCYADGQDAVVASFIIDSPDAFENHLNYAADVDFDGSVTETDYYIISGYAIGLDFVLQG